MSSAKVVRVLFKNQSCQTLTETPYPRHHPPDARRIGKPLSHTFYLPILLNANSNIGAPLLIAVMK
jgi:hypothetical protein